jgi:integrase/recombinase XerC
MKRGALPALSGVGEQTLASYEHTLRQEEDLAQASIRNYHSDLRHFAAWCEARWQEGREHEPPFTPAAVTTPTLTQYRTYVQHTLHLKPASVNRAHQRETTLDDTSAGGSIGSFGQVSGDLTG